jgi:alkanesulfonate monooxygenase SsuD/methylene tetrahydromethanopterin reductase-like flavin-dependent oxidoreductase (luciferase family)
MVAMSPDSLEVAANMGLGVMLFSQFQWEKVEPGLSAYRADYKRLNGEEAPPPIVNDFVVCHPDCRKAEEIARKHIVGYYWSIMEHYELAGDHFETTGKSYAYYAKGSEALRAAGHDAVIEEFLDANLWGDPDLILKKLQHRRSIIGDFEVNGVLSYQSQPYEQVERCMRLFAKEVGTELKNWVSRCKAQEQEPSPLLDRRNART